MAVPKQHDSKSKVGRRRSQKKLKKQNIVACSNCSAPNLPHRACASCGYHGKKSKSSSPILEKEVKKEVEKTEEKSEEESEQENNQEA